MEKEIQTLLKMLNGTLREMPGFLKRTVVQYQWQQGVEGALYLIAAICLAVFVFKSVMYLIKRKVDLEDSPFILFFYPIIIIGCVFMMGLSFKMSVGHIGNAISPVTSLIQEFQGIGQ